jgi:hypothetical protein
MGFCVAVAKLLNLANKQCPHGAMDLPKTVVEIVLLALEIEFPAVGQE